MVWHILGAYFFLQLAGGGGQNYFHSGTEWVAFKLGAETGEGDERRKIQFAESGGSLNGPDLFTELPFL